MESDLSDARSITPRDNSHPRLPALFRIDYSYLWDQYDPISVGPLTMASLG
jgi:hypothetical protein